jgi:hypothetical protein
VPEVAKTSHWPYEALGVGYGLLGAGFVVAGYRRTRSIERALDRGAFAPLSDRVLLALTAAGVVLAAATIVVLIAVR